MEKEDSTIMRCEFCGAKRRNSKERYRCKFQCGTIIYSQGRVERSVECHKEERQQKYDKIFHTYASAVFAALISKASNNYGAEQYIDEAFTITQRAMQHDRIKEELK